MVQQIYFGKENDGTKSATTSLKNGVDTPQYVLKTWKKKCSTLTNLHAIKFTIRFHNKV